MFRGPEQALEINSRGEEDGEGEQAEEEAAAGRQAGVQPLLQDWDGAAHIWTWDAGYPGLQNIC